MLATWQFPAIGYCQLVIILAPHIYDGAMLMLRIRSGRPPLSNVVLDFQYILKEAL